ncbi:MAG: VOC family protein [Actinomycetota bacterium]
MQGLAQVNLIVSDVERAKEFWAVLGFPWSPRHPKAAVIAFDSGMNLVVHEPEFARLWDPAFSGPSAGSTVVDINVASRADVDDLHERVLAAGFSSSVEPWDTFFGARYAIVCDADGHRVGLKSPLDPSRFSPPGE